MLGEEENTAMLENITFGSGGVSLPEGTYYGEFTGVEKVANKFQPDKGALRWDWKVTGGDNQGKTISRTTGDKPGPDNACGRIIIGLLGKTPAANEVVDIKACVGRKYICQVVKAKDSTSTRVESVTLLP
jgi:hypothetical protein